MELARLLGCDQLFYINLSHLRVIFDPEASAMTSFPFFQRREEALNALFEQLARLENDLDQVGSEHGNRQLVQALEETVRSIRSELVHLV